MLDLLSGIDAALFRFINGTIANPVTDLLMPLLTDLNRHWWGWAILAGLWLWLMAGFGPKGRIAGILLLVTVAVSDQLNSSVLKFLFDRPRPCHEGSPVFDAARLLVDCGAGFSFPSSHAANNFAAAFVVRSFFPGKGALFLAAASVIALSRTFIGVHYPGDLLAGAAVGWGAASAVIYLWTAVSKKIQSGRDANAQGRPA